MSQEAALLDQGLRYDLVEAVLAARGDDPCVAQQSIEALAPLIPAIQIFFDKVLVMHEDQAIRQTRQALLQHIWHLADGISDLTKVEGF